MKYFCNANAAPPQVAVKAGDETLVQLVPLGSHPQWNEEGERFDQVCDEETFQTLLENFAGEVLVDADHASERGDARDTRAYAWIQALSLDETGALCGLFKWTDIGAEAVSGRRYRFVSVCWVCKEEGKGQVRPVQLVSVALTNTPNIEARPILNAQTESDGGASADNKETTHMEQLKTLLGLAPDATEEDVLAAVTALQEQVAAANEEKEEAEASAFAEEHKDKVTDASALAAAYRKDKALARAMVENFKAPAAPAAPAAPVSSVCNAELARRPDIALGGAAGLARCASPEERIAYLQSHRS